MKKIHFSILFICLTAMLTASCGDSFFELEPSSEVSTSKLFKTAGDFNIAIVGCYAKLQGQTSFYTECCEYRSDNLYLSAPTTGTQDRYDIDQFTDKPSNGILDEYWANFNNGVYRCNIVLDRIDNADFDETLKKQYKGEALFIRAFTYFNMYRIWGGVPTTTHVISATDALTVKRSSEDEMMQLITGDLKTIIEENLLPESYLGDDIGRATIGAAKTLLGKVYLTFKQWTEARDVLSSVLGKYLLQENPGDVFDVKKKMNSEVIFAVRFNKGVVGEGHGNWYSVANLSDNNNQTEALKGCYTTDDKRKSLITYVQVESGVCLMNKFYDTKDATTNTVGNDQIVLRYADVLLMYAEALNEISFAGTNTSEAYLALNEVHTRSLPTSIDMSSIKSKDDFRRAILLERQKEFPYEGHRWFDLVRMGYAQEVMATEGHAISQDQYLFPIPQSAIERVNNSELLWQNDGYR